MSVSETEIRKKFWNAIKSDRVLMLGLATSPTGHAQPMTAQLEGDDEAGPLWIFTSRDTDFAKALGQGARGMGHFVAKDHGLFASIEGDLAVSEDAATIDRLWNPWVGAWFDGKNDPKILLVRFDVEHAQVWLNDTGWFEGIKLLLGADPKKEFADKVADVPLQNGARPS